MLEKSALGYLVKTTKLVVFVLEEISIEVIFDETLFIFIIYKLDT